MNTILLNTRFVVVGLAALILFSACAKKPEMKPEGPPKPPWTQSMYQKLDHETFASQVPANTIIDTRYMDYPLLNAAVFYETNRQRVLNGLKPFMHSPALEKTAWEHSMDMVKLDFFSGSNPQEGRKTLKDRMAKIGIDNATIAENIGIGFVLDYEPDKPVFTPKQNKGFFSYTHKGKPIPNHTYLNAARALVKTWMDSPENRAPILNPELIYMGAGGGIFTEKEVWEKMKFTQNFASVKGQE